MTVSHHMKAMLLALGLGLVTAAGLSSAAFAQPTTRAPELVNRLYSPGYYGGYYAGREGTNYDREVNGSTASTPGDN